MRNGGYGIENLTVSFGISSLSFSTTDGAKKESHTSGSSIGIALFGNFEDRGDAHYLSRDSE